MYENVEPQLQTYLPPDHSQLLPRLQNSTQSSTSSTQKENKFNIPALAAAFTAFEGRVDTLEADFRVANTARTLSMGPEVQKLDRGKKMPGLYAIINEIQCCAAIMRNPRESNQERKLAPGEAGRE
ncbi:hypothetical protein CMUS01_13096 [Colletotrichum musicola]|uniref:Uncharacterized protein n=1 Tax=Colletotrichum musicola TaxID=2175873 RepID=A0A8H6MX57_9PEZI|nr:hypothetical protein CMUS01_13096 [Colletotrichum musicola]